jgi:hypothetical protein
LPTYGVITVTGVDPKAVRSRLKRHHIEYEADGRTEKFRVRATHWINLNLLTSSQKRQLLQTGKLTVAAAEFYSRTNDRVAALRTL